MNVRWQTSFKDTADNLVEVLIYDPDYTGEDVVTLTASANPLEIDTDDSDDVLQPIRSATGYINVIFEDDQSEVFPQDYTDRPVVVKRDGQTIWQGFIMPNTYTQPWTAYPFEMQLPIGDELEVLNNIEISATGGYGYTTFGALIEEAFDATGLPHRNVFIPSEWNGNTAMMLAVAKMAFFRKSGIALDSPDYVEMEGMKYGEILAEIMKAFGWCIYTDGSDIRIASFGHRGYITVPFEELTTDTPRQADALNTIELPGIKSANHSLSSINPSKGVTVTVEATEGEEIFNLNLDDAEFEGESDLYSAAGYMPLQRSRIIPKEYRFIAGTTTRIVEEHFSPSDFITQQSNHYGAMLVRERTANEGDVRYSFVNGLFLANTFPVSGGTIPHPTHSQFQAHPHFTIKAPYVNLKHHSCLAIETKGPQNLTMHTLVRIGNHYWNGNDWGASPVWLAIPMNDDNKSLSGVTAAYNDAKGHIMATASSPGIDGDMQIDVYFYTPSSTGLGNAVIEAFSVNVYPATPMNAEAKKKQSYYGTTGKRGDTVDIVLAFLTKNLTPDSDNTLMLGADYAGPENMTKAGVGTRLENDLVAKATEAYGKKRNVLSVEVEDTGMEAGRIVNVDGKLYVTMAKSLNLRDNNATLTLIEL